jgi:hypothetical protein
MTAAHATAEGSLSRVRSVLVRSVDSVKELSALMAADEIFYGKCEHTAAREFHLIG